MDVSQIEFGIDSFGDRPPDDHGEVAAGTVSASARLRAVELYGTEVIPRVRELLAEQLPARRSPTPQHPPRQDA